MIAQGDSDCRALLDSGATHAVVPYKSDMSGLQRVSVTLAGDQQGGSHAWWNPCCPTGRTRVGQLLPSPDYSSLGGASPDPRLYCYLEQAQGTESSSSHLRSPEDRGLL